MSATLGFVGWLVAVAGVAAAGIAHVRLARHLEAVARASHELRGPLTAVRLALELAARLRQLPRDRLRAIELELGRATIALEDLGAARVARLGRTGSGRDGGAEPFDLCQLVTDSVEAWHAPAAARGVDLQLVRPGHELLVVGQRLRLAQAIGNLLANAIEHGGGTVMVRLRREPSGIRLEIVDQGPGLPAPVDRLRQRPRRLRPRRRRDGRGHGLAVVSAVAAAHGGRLAAAPSDRGARLVLELPSATSVAAELTAG
jgi:signal transduction histidine kinase